MSELYIINSHYSKIRKFLGSFNMGSQPTDFLNEGASRQDSIANAAVIREIDSVGYFDSELVYYFHQRINDPKKLLIIGLYKLENKSQIAIQYTVDFKPSNNPIYNIELRK